MEKLKKVLDVWTALAVHIKVRDRAVKTIQYSCQMLLGYYGTLFSKNLIESLTLLRRACSTSRKAFWLLKSINHFKFIYEMVESYSFSTDEAFINLFCILEQIALVFYYWYENLVFLARNKLVKFSEDDVDDMTNLTWFWGDVFCFFASFFTLVIDCRNIYRSYLCYYNDKKNRISDSKNIDLNYENTDGTIIENKISKSIIEHSKHFKAFLISSKTALIELFDHFLSFITVLRYT
jgi:hypothetical protein